MVRSCGKEKPLVPNKSLNKTQPRKSDVNDVEKEIGYLEIVYEALSMDVAFSKRQECNRGFKNDFRVGQFDKGFETRKRRKIITQK